MYPGITRSRDVPGHHEEQGRTGDIMRRCRYTHGWWEEVPVYPRVVGRGTRSNTAGREEGRGVTPLVGKRDGIPGWWEECTTRVVPLYIPFGHLLVLYRLFPRHFSSVAWLHPASWHVDRLVCTAAVRRR